MDSALILGRSTARMWSAVCARSESSPTYGINPVWDFVYIHYRSTTRDQRLAIDIYPLGYFRKPAEDWQRQHESDSNSAQNPISPPTSERDETTVASSMFLIPPRSKKAAEWPPLPNERRFTRVRAACDRCRIKKTKCDGTRPCLRCRHDDVICVDNRRGDREPKMVSAE